MCARHFDTFHCKHPSPNHSCSCLFPWCTAPSSPRLALPYSRPFVYFTMLEVVEPSLHGAASCSVSCITQVGSEGRCMFRVHAGKARQLRAQNGLQCLICGPCCGRGGPCNLDRLGEGHRAVVMEHLATNEVGNLQSQGCKLSPVIPISGYQ